MSSKLNRVIVCLAIVVMLTGAPMAGASSNGVDAGVLDGARAAVAWVVDWLGDLLGKKGADADPQGFGECEEPPGSEWGPFPDPNGCD